MVSSVDLRLVKIMAVSCNTMNRRHHRVLIQRLCYRTDSATAITEADNWFHLVKVRSVVHNVALRLLCKRGGVARNRIKISSNRAGASS